MDGQSFSLGEKLFPSGKTFFSEGTTFSPAIDDPRRSEFFLHPERIGMRYGIWCYFFGNLMN
jgi:hypothetical protein